MPKEMLAIQLPNQMNVEATVQEWLIAMLLDMTGEQRARIIGKVQQLKKVKLTNIPIVGKNNHPIGL